MTITGGSALSKDDIDRMMKEAESFAEEDRKRREAAEIRNNADNLAYQAEKTLKELGDKVSQEDREAVEKAVAEVKAALEGDDAALIKQTTDALMEAFQKVGQAVYAQQQQDGGGGQPGAAQADDVVEGEVVDEGGA